MTPASNPFPLTAGAQPLVIYLAASIGADEGDGPDFARFRITDAWLARLASLYALLAQYDLASVEVLAPEIEWSPTQLDLELGSGRLSVDALGFSFAAPIEHASYNAGASLTFHALTRALQAARHPDPLGEAVFAGDGLRYPADYLSQAQEAFDPTELHAREDD